MITFFLTSLILMSTMKMSTNPNPVKLSLMLLMSSLMFFFMMYTKTSMVWYPTIYFLIFMGGILIMFMILSSIMPNEKMTKNKIMYSFFIVMIMFNYQNQSNFNTMPNLASMKISLNSSLSMSMLVTMMLIYFFLTLNMLASNQTPMRSHTCCSLKLIL